MIKLEVEVEDWTGDYVNGDSSTTLVLPCDLNAVLRKSADYVICDTSPDVPLPEDIDIWKLNDVLDSINAENPEMTEDLLVILMEALNIDDITNEAFVERIKDKDFLFEDLSDEDVGYSEEDTAAYYIASTMKVPFHSGVTSDMLEALCSDELMDYVDWAGIWEEYSQMGFVISSDYDSSGNTRYLYLIHWKQ